MSPFSFFFLHTSPSLRHLILRLWRSWVLIPRICITVKIRTTSQFSYSFFFGGGDYPNMTHLRWLMEQWFNANKTLKCILLYQLFRWRIKSVAKCNSILSAMRNTQLALCKLPLHCLLFPHENISILQTLSLFHDASFLLASRDN